jgi:hypothetical protein
LQIGQTRCKPAKFFSQLTSRPGSRAAMPRMARRGQADT